MRIVRPGVMPSAAAAACSAVVLNGVGGATLRLFFSAAVTEPEVAAEMAAMTRFASASLLNRSTACPAENSVPSASPPSERNLPFTVQ
jgi:hypothetical protein